MLNFADFVTSKNFTETQRYNLILEYESFYKTGVIGECELRTLAIEFQDNLGIPIAITSTMKDIALDCYRYFTNKYFEYKGY